MTVSSGTERRHIRFTSHVIMHSLEQERKSVVGGLLLMSQLPKPHDYVGNYYGMDINKYV